MKTKTYTVALELWNFDYAEDEGYILTHVDIEVYLDIIDHKVYYKTKDIILDIDIPEKMQKIFKRAKIDKIIKSDEIDYSLNEELSSLSERNSLVMMEFIPVKITLDTNQSELLSTLYYEWNLFDDSESKPIYNKSNFIKNLKE